MAAQVQSGRQTALMKRSPILDTRLWMQRKADWFTSKLKELLIRRKGRIVGVWREWRPSVAGHQILHDGNRLDHRGVDGKSLAGWLEFHVRCSGVLTEGCAWVWMSQDLRSEAINGVGDGATQGGRHPTHHDAIAPGAWTHDAAIVADNGKTNARRFAVHASSTGRRTHLRK